jgi:membrane associated rhomboid family serine protease
MFTDRPGPEPRPEPILLAPPPLIVLIGLLIAIHAIRSLVFGLYDEEDIRLLDVTAFVPARFSLWVGLTDPSAVLETLREGSRQAQELRSVLHQLFVASGSAAPWTLVTYAFLHGSWEHVIVNGLWMLAFGSPVMRRFGVARFFAFFAVTAAAAAAFHALVNPTDVAVLVGASGAVSGLTAASLRFAIGPGLLSGRADWRKPAAPLAEALRDRQVLIFVAVWFGINLIAGLGAPFGGEGMRIAWEAHVGGFVAGLLLFSLFDPFPAR